MTAAPARIEHVDRPQIGLDQDARGRIAEALGPVLADTFTLYLKTHNYHWNVTGPQFVSLHALFEEQYTDLWNAADEIAERIRAIGHPAPGSFQAYTRLGSIEGDDKVPTADEMVRNLMRDHERIDATLRKALKVVQDAADEATADLLIQRMRFHEKTAWMLRSQGA